MGSAAGLSGSPAPPPQSAGGGWVDAAAAVLLFAALASLRPALPDGDGLSYADQALKPGWLDGADAKHLLYAPLLRAVLRALDAFGGGAFALEAFTALSNLCGAALYLMLARGLYPVFLCGRTLARLCALGALFSFGALAACCTIETYALALLLDVVLATLCARTDLSTARGGVAAGLAFALAVGVHVTNVLMGPFLLLVLLAHARRRASWSSASWFLGAAAFGGLLLALVLMVGKDVWPWSPDWQRLLPQGDPHPPLSPAGRAGRVAYGLLRTLAWLPPFWELTPPFIAGYALALLAALALAAVVLRRALPRRRGNRWLGRVLAAQAIPFAVIGARYYPSDPERWLFLLPSFWLLVGLAWSRYTPPPRAWLTRGRSVALLAVCVAALAVHNTAGKLLPDARHNPELQGLRLLAAETAPGDLVVASTALRSPVVALALGQPLRCEVISLDLMMRAHGDAVGSCQNDLRDRIQDALARGRRVFAYGLLNEGLAAGRGYPWAHVLHLGYEPDMLLSVLNEFLPGPVRPREPGEVGLYRLQAGDKVDRE